MDVRCSTCRYLDSQTRCRRHTPYCDPSGIGRWPRISEPSAEWCGEWECAVGKINGEAISPEPGPVHEPEPEPKPEPGPIHEPEPEPKSGSPIYAKAKPPPGEEAPKAKSVPFLPGLGVPLKREKKRKSVPTEKPILQPVEPDPEALIFHWREDILEQLKDYHICMRKLKEHDRGSYDLYSQVGLMLHRRPEHAWLGLEPHWYKPDTSRKREGIGGIAICNTSETVKAVDNPNHNLVPWKFGYFTKLKATPPKVEHPGFEGDTYSMTLFYSRQWCEGDKKRKYWGKFGWPYICYIHLAPDGKMALLRERCNHPNTFYSKKGSYRGRITINQEIYDYPKFLRNTSYNNKGERRPKLPPEETAFKIFITMISTYEQSSAGVRIRTEKAGIVATFSVDLLNTPYFFRDREITVTKNGRKKPIFHIVKSHRRMIINKKTGKSEETYVKSHCQGERHFEWNGYKVTITMPGLHHSDLLDLSAAAEIEFDDKVEMVGPEKMGKILDSRMNV